MTILCIYTREPSFPPTDNHPDAVRHKVGSYFVDAVGAKPDLAEVDAIMVQSEPETRDLAAELANLESRLLAVEQKSGSEIP